MVKQRDIAELREAVRSSGFTPSVRDVDTLVELFADPDEAVAHAAELAVVRAGTSTGPPVVARLLARLVGAGPLERARGLRALGRLSPTDAAAARWVVAGLGDGDDRVKRAAAHALGRLGQSEAAPDIAAAILRAWDDVPDLPLARALAEAMGKLGLVDARARLEAVDGCADGGGSDRELARVARKALAMLRRDDSRGEASTIDGDRSGDFDVDLVLLCRAGLEGMVAEELREKCSGAREARPGPDGSGQVTAVWRGAPASLFAVRTMLGFGFALPTERFPSDADVTDACARALTSKVATRIVEEWTLGAVRYRLGWDGQGHRRGATWSVVHAVAERHPRWVNDPTESTWEVRVRVADGAVRALLVPHKLTDPRFAYRLRDVPAASHPTLAAALVRASRPGPDDVVWDPFAGSGTELIERARAGSYLRLVGSDLDESALSAARANVGSAAIADVTLEIGDATRHAPPGVTRIVTNPPMGRRVARDGSLADLLDAFIDHVARVLPAGGRLAWLSPLGGRTAARAEASGLRVVLRHSVDMGGFHSELQVAERG